MIKVTAYDFQDVHQTDGDLVVAFYGRSTLFHLFGKKDREEYADSIIKALLKYSPREIIEIVKPVFRPFVIQKKDVPQFSDLLTTFRIPSILKNCGLNGVGYEQMGYMLRNEKRKAVADMKYGENHMKTAEQMGLCDIIHYKAYPNEIGNCFLSLDKESQTKLIPHFCLSIPFMQNYFMTGMNEETIKEMMSILSESTIKRRLTNVNKLISTIKASIDGL